MPDDLIGQAIVTAAFILAAAQIWCVRAWLNYRRMQAILTPPDPRTHPDQEHTHG